MSQITHFFALELWLTKIQTMILLHFERPAASLDFCDKYSMFNKKIHGVVLRRRMRLYASAWRFRNQTSTWIF